MTAPVRIGTERRFDTVKVLLVEDETLVSFLVEDMLLELGCSGVSHASAIDDALMIARERRPDVAVLDVNLGGELVYALADQLDRSGIPLIFTTGYGRDSLPERWVRRPLLQKPFSSASLASALGLALHR
jgi:CheY-like chemotaxis protein